MHIVLPVMRGVGGVVGWVGGGARWVLAMGRGEPTPIKFLVFLLARAVVQII